MEFVLITLLKQGALIGRGMVGKIPCPGTEAVVEAFGVGGFHGEAGD